AGSARAGRSRRSTAAQTRGELRVHERHRNRHAGRDNARQLPNGGRRRYPVRRTDSRVHALGAPCPTLGTLSPAGGILRVAVLAFPSARQRPPHEERDERQGECRLEHDDPQSGTHLATPFLSPWKAMIEHLRCFFPAAAGLIAGCALLPPPNGACPCPGLPTVAPRVNALEPVDFAALTGWKEGEQAAAWPAFLASCQALRWREAWHGVCARAMELRSPGDEEARRFLEENFTPWRLANPDGALDGLVTGYYEPLLRGSRARTTPFLYPLYGPPDDLLTIDLSATNPELRGMRLRGRVEGKRVVPYYSRAEIARGAAPVAGKEILWVDDPIEAFFLQIQGSGRIQLESGETLRLGYADQNGHPFQSIGRYLVERGELQLGEASMPAIKAWAATNPKRLE